MLKKLLSTCFIMFLGITFIKSADAHVTLNPDKGEPNTYEKYEIRVPVEKMIMRQRLILKCQKVFN